VRNGLFSIAGMTMARESQSTWRNPFPSARLPTTDFIFFFILLKEISKIHNKSHIF